MVASTYGGETTINGGILQLGVSNTLPDGAGKGGVTIASGARLRLNGFSDTINGLSGAGIVDNNSAATNAVFTVGAGNASATFTGTIVNGAAATTALTKTGAGTQTLTGGNSFTGPTVVDQGTLLVSGSLSGTTNATVGGSGSAATLQVSGSVNPASLTTILNQGVVTGTGSVGGLLVESGGTVSPGGTPGTLTATSATFMSGGAFKLELLSDGTGVAGTDWDKLAVTGTLDLSNLSSSSQFVLTLQTLSAVNTPSALATFDMNASHTWASILTAGTITGFSADKFVVNTSGFLNPTNGAFSVAQNGSNLDLVYLAVPEPNALTMLAGSLGLAVGLQRFRRRGQRA